MELLRLLQTRTVTTGGVCPPIAGTLPRFRLRMAAHELGMTYRAGINAAFQTQDIVTLPANGYGLAANSINIGANKRILVPIRTYITAGRPDIHPLIQRG